MSLRSPSFAGVETLEATIALLTENERFSYDCVRRYFMMLLVVALSQVLGGRRLFLLFNLSILSPPSLLDNKWLLISIRLNSRAWGVAALSFVNSLEKILLGTKQILLRRPYSFYSKRDL